jgi:putative ABC transport system permease protein
VAVAAGAEGVATLEGSWQLDPQAPLTPPDPPVGEPLPDTPVPGVRNPPLPPGNTVVWRADITTPLDYDQRDMLLIDAERFRDVALWGRGADLAAARAAIDAIDVPAGHDGPIPAIAVADPASDGLDTIAVNLGYAEPQNLQLVARVPAFPGMQPRPMYVVSADAMFAAIDGPSDPRLRPRSGLGPSPMFARTYLWSRDGAAGVNAVVAPQDVRPERVETAAELRQSDAYVATGRARGYQLAVAGYLALLAVLTLCVYAQRTAAARRPADLMLARVGFGRARVARARVLEFVLLAAIALGTAVAAVAALAPLGGRLLDDQPGLRPAFAFRLSPLGLMVAAAIAVVGTIGAVLLTTARSASAEEAAYRDD